MGTTTSHRILLWWALIFALSLLARYEPVAWQAALDRSSPRMT